MNPTLIERKTIVCRPAKEGDKSIEFLRWFHDDEVRKTTCQSVP